MPKKLEKEQAVELFASMGYNLLDEYTNSSTKMLCEKDGYWYKISYSNLRMGKKPSLWGINNADNLEHNIGILFSKRGIKSTYIGHEVVRKNKRIKILVKMICSCGKEFVQCIEDIPGNVHIVCPDCQKKARGKTRRKSKENIELILRSRYKILDSRSDIRNTDYVEVEDELGYKGFISSQKIKQGCKMSKFDIRVNKKYYIYNVNHYAKLHNWDVKCLGFGDRQYHKNRQSLKFRCSCGEEFETNICLFEQGKTVCSKCAKSVSRYEELFKAYLERKNIQYIFQYSFNDCRDVLPLPFDFYLPQYNVLIEIDGEGHFHPCHFNQISKEKAEKTFVITKEHDEIKNVFCQKNNIPLIRIPYYYFTDNSFEKFFEQSLECSEL